MYIFVRSIRQTQIKLNKMKANTKVNGTANYSTATEIWYNKLTPMQRVEIIKMFDFKSMTKTFRACINHISINIEQYA